MALLPILRRLAPASTSPASSESSTSTIPSDPVVPSRVPDPQILAHLLAHIFNNNYTILSLFRPESLTEQDEDEQSGLNDKLGEVILRWGSALRLLWAYLWGFDEPTAKGKAKANPRQEEACVCGHYEADTPDRATMVKVTLRILLAAAQASIANLFLIDTYLPHVKAFLMTRLYGIEPKRKYEVTFPPREDWHVRDDGEEDFEEQSWKEPSPSLRAVYLALLRRMLEAGVTQRLTWRLFSLAKTPSKWESTVPKPNGTASTNETGVESQSPSQPDADDTPRPSRKRPRPPHLTIPATLSPHDLGTERLNAEVLDLVRHTMKVRWPSAFVLRGGSSDEEGGLELADLGRPWPPALKGFNFSVRCIGLYGGKL